MQPQASWGYVGGYVVQVMTTVPLMASPNHPSTSQGMAAAHVAWLLAYCCRLQGRMASGSALKREPRRRLLNLFIFPQSLAEFPVLGAAGICKLRPKAVLPRAEIELCVWPSVYCVHLMLFVCYEWHFILAKRTCVVAMTFCGSSLMSEGKWFKTFPLSFSVLITCPYVCLSVPPKFFSFIRQFIFI